MKGRHVVYAKPPYRVAAREARMDYTQIYLNQYSD